MRGIGKSFAGVRVLDDVQLTLYAGETHILAGENGAGKSTLIKILAGIYTEFTGEISFNGRPVRFKNPQAASALGIRVIHQELSLVREMSVLDNLFLGRELCRYSMLRRKTQREQAAALLQRLGLDLDLQRTAGSYPLGLQQMIEIAKALLGDAVVLILDEPTSALTGIEAEKLFAFMAALKERGCALIYISHKMEEIYRLADRITVLRDGRWIGSERADALPRAEMIRWMVGRELTGHFPARPALVPGAPALLRVTGFSVADPAGKRDFAVRDLSLEVRRGEIVGLAGLQGAGNSELLLGLFGAYPGGVRGLMEVEGKRLTPGSPAMAIAAGLALVTNDRKQTGLIADHSIRWNLTLAALRRLSPAGWLRPRRERACAADYLERLAIRAASSDQPVATLSGGNQQKVVLSKWLATQPRVLLLDEPTRGVDIGAKHEIYELMNQWTAQGLGILLITSEMPELLALSDRILVMHGGRVTAELSRRTATPEGIMRAAMGEEAAA